MTPLTRAITEALFQFVSQGAIVLLLLWVTLFALRRQRPEIRYAAACAALLLLAALPLVTVWRLYQPSAVLQAAAPQLRLTESVSSAGPMAPYARKGILYEWAFTVWVAGAGFLGLRFTWGALQLYRLRRSGGPADSQTSAFIQRLAARMNVRRFQVLFSPATDVPSVIGWFRPVILLPASALTGLTPNQLEAIFAHELAHIRRHDYAVNLLQMVVETLLFYHPAVWWTSHRIRVERELCCDDAAVRLCGDPVAYARALATIERTRILKPDFAVGSGDGPLLQRIRRLLSPDPPVHAPSRFAGALVLLSLAILAAVTIPRDLGAQNETPGIVAGSILQVSSKSAEISLPKVAALQQNAPAAGTRPANPEVQTAVNPTASAQAPDGYFLYLNGQPFSSNVSEDQAAALRANFTGDFLWFRRSGTTYVTQDRSVLDRFAAAYVPQPLPQNETELARSLERRAEESRQRAQVAEMERLRSEIQRVEEMSRRGLLSPGDANRARDLNASIIEGIILAERIRQRRSQPDTSAALTQDEAAIRNSMAALQAQLAQLQADITQKQETTRSLQEALSELRSRLENMTKEVDSSNRNSDILRDAIESGTARPLR